MYDLKITNKVTVVDIVVEGGQAVLESIQNDGGEAIFLTGDVSNEKAVNKMGKDTVDALGRLDFAVNNVGIGGAQALTGEYGINN